MISIPSIMRHAALPSLWMLLSVFMLDLLLPAISPCAVPMKDDPKGFQGIAWGTSLTLRQDLEAVRSGTHVTEYRMKDGTTAFAGAEMTSLLYVSFDDQFARVTIRYQGESVHKQVLSFLEHRHGNLQRIPGQMARGLNQQYTWRGSETEINLTYQGSTGRGYIFIDSRNLAPRFNDDLTDSAE